MSVKMFVSEFSSFLQLREFWDVEIHSNSVNAKSDATVFVRTGSLHGIFERISFVLDGSQIYVDLGARPVPGVTGWHTMSISRRLTDVETKIPRSSKRLKEWTDALASVAEKECRFFASDEGPSLLNRTVRARAAARYYLSQLSASYSDIRSYRDDLMLSATGHQRELARKSLTPALLCTRGKGQEFEDEAMAVYQTIALTITLDEDGERLGFFAPGTSPLEDKSLPVCIQIMASCLFNEKGIDWIRFD